jgi:hypothetical protein
LEVSVTSALTLIADMVWPALILEQRLVSVIPITVGLLTEWLALRLGGFGLTWKRAAVIDIVMNLVSTVAGIPLIPLLGLAWEVFPGQVLYKFFNIGTFNPGTWVATFMMATLATTGVEAAVVRWGFKIALGWRRFGVLGLANSLSIAIAFVSLWLRPPQM